MLRMILASTGLLFIFGEWACTSKAPYEKVLEKDTAAEIQPLCREGVIDYEIKTIKNTGTDPKNRSKIIAEAHIKYPVLQCANTKLKESVNQYISNFVESVLKANMNADDTSKVKSMATASKAFISSCKSNIADAKKEDPDMDQVWYCDVIGNIEMQSGNYFTVRFKYNSYTGGAHGDYGEDYATFNIKTGQKLGWNDVIVDLEKFKKLAELRFKQVNGMSANSKLTEEEGFSFENNKFSLSNNFALTSEGLILYYQPYEVAPFSFGATTLIFKYFEIAEFINPLLFSEPV